MPHVQRNPQLDGPLMEGLVEVWTAVSNAGGAVGFLPPVTAADVWPVADAAFARVREGVDDLAVAYDDDAGGMPVGLGFLSSNDWQLARHWGTVKRLQRHPERGGRGIGTALLDELEAAARDRGFHRLVLTVRGGTGREGFYLTRGFRLEARLPGRLRVATSDLREELVMSKVLVGADEEPTSSQATLPIHRLDTGLPLPAYAQPGDAGLDLRTAEDVTLAPGERAVVPTGIAVAVPPGCVGLVHPRSGLAARAGLTIVNAPGTIDAGYRGEVKVVLVNLDPREPITLVRGDRIAQLLVQQVETVTVREVAELPPTTRGDGGFGSTGR